VFRRSTTNGTKADQPGAVPASSEATQPSSGKGRPTRKRREAEAARRVPFIERATRGSRPSRAELYARREAMRRGEESALPARDRGPVRRFARDYVDARRNLAGLFLPLGLPLIILLNVPSPLIRYFAALLLYALVFAIIFDSIFLAWAVRRAAAARFPGEPLRGLGMYAVLRAMQLRRARIPAPRVRRGEKV